MMVDGPALHHRQDRRDLVGGEPDPVGYLAFPADPKGQERDPAVPCPCGWPMYAAAAPGAMLAL
jgi:hypothetical protein